jgi:replicative DNA helicase
MAKQVDDGLDARSLPHSLDAERSILGAILVHNEAFERVQRWLTSDDFYRDAHRRIFTAITTLIESKVAVDYVTLKEELLRVGDLDGVGGPSYISGLADGMPRATNVDYYAGIVREKALLRALIYAANTMLTDAYAAEDTASELLLRADRTLLDLHRGTKGSGLAPVGAGLSALMTDIERRTQARGTVIGLDTGYPSINELTLGWQPGDLTVVAARPSIGKTTFAFNTGLFAAQQGMRVGAFSLEMKKRQLEYRLLSQLSRVPATRILSGFLGALDYGKISEALEVLHALPLHLDDRTGLTVGVIRSSCRRMKSDGGLDLVIVDYVQLMRSELTKANRNEQITDISRRLKELADELNVPILLVSQLSRANEKRADPRPRLSDLRESGALEQDADNVCFLHRENHRAGGSTEFIIEKQRNGPTGTTILNLDRDTVTFSDDGPAPEEPLQPASVPLPGMERQRRRRPA